ncbi:MAG: domain containing protein [Myxococcales bacterium]|nr:domain containing protein [Myxococcales bacterium]
MDQSKKTMRHFYCRDVLWETFEQMANDFDCSIDYLVNEAMRYYARSKNYQSPGGPPGGGPQPTGGQPLGNNNNNNSGANSFPGGNTGKPPPRNAPQTQQPPPSSNPGNRPNNSDAGRARPAPPTPGYAAPRAGAAPGGMGGAGGGPMSQPRPEAAAPAAPPPPMGSAGPTLFLVYNGQRYPVTKDQFIIGRGSKTSDLPIKDGNISRKHAAVIRRNGTFYIKDLGSTNGIDYKGMRIDNKRIDEGDVFHLCDYELRFTYRVD